MAPSRGAKSALKVFLVRGFVLSGGFCWHLTGCCLERSEPEPARPAFEGGVCNGALADALKRGTGAALCLSKQLAFRSIRT